MAARALPGRLSDAVRVLRRAPAGSIGRDARQVEYCVASGAHGIAALGLGTEVSKLAPRSAAWSCTGRPRISRGRLPLAITVFGATPAEQIAFVRAAAERGADWVILQPPQPAAGQAGAPITEDQLVDFFGAVADAAPLPVAIQNAPQYIGVGLTSAGLDRLSREHPNVRLLKAEGSAVETAGADRADRGPHGGVPGPRRHGVHRRDACGLRRHDPLGQILPRPGPACSS